MNTWFILLLTLPMALSGHDSGTKNLGAIDIEKTFQDLRNEIAATKHDNNLLRTELADIRKGTFEHASDKKRLVLHSEQDIHTAIQELRNENNAQKAELAELRKSQGSSYIRWGRTVCSGNGTENVYSGYTGGSPYDLVGGAASYICLPEHPSWAHYMDGMQDRGGYVDGTEYEITYTSFADIAFGKPVHDQDAPCVVCRSPRPVSIMIPGSTGCNTGWTLEYTGYLMTGLHSHKSGTDYACVDKNPEAVFHGEANQNGKLFFFAEVQCGSLPCQEYPKGRELVCAVCSK